MNLGLNEGEKNGPIECLIGKQFAFFFIIAVAWLHARGGIQPAAVPNKKKKKEKNRPTKMDFVSPALFPVFKINRKSVMANFPLHTLV